MTDHSREDNWPARRIDRRRLLQYGAGAALGAVVASKGWFIERAWASDDPPPVPPPAGPTPSLTTMLRRREDFVRLRFDFYNLQLDTTGAEPRLVRIHPNSPAHVVIGFPAQAIAEQAFYDFDDKAQPDCAKPEEGKCDPKLPISSDAVASPPVGARLGGESRLAYLIPPSIAEIPYTAAGLLSWNEWTLRVVPAALPPGTFTFPPGQGPEVREPQPLETALELPWWLITSPHADAAWAHDSAPVTHAGVTELWHTRLGVKGRNGVDEHDAEQRTVRAVWNRDPDFAAYLGSNGENFTPLDGEGFPAPIGYGLPFRMALSPRDRFDLVVSTTDWQDKVSDRSYQPQPAEVNRLMLSSLGGWLDVQGQWRAEPDGLDSGTSLQSWRHLATLGRDHYVRVLIRSGCCYPHRHGMSLVKVTERRFRTNRGRRIAYLFQRYFLVFRQREVVYGTPAHDHEGRRLPFTSIRVTTLITPTIDKPDGIDLPDDLPDLGITMAFVPKIGDKPLLVHMVGTDRAGRRIDFDTPIVFVDGTKVADQEAMENLATWYMDPDTDDVYRTINLYGAKVAVAEPAQPCDTDLEVHRLTWGVEPPKPGTPSVPRYFPTMAEAEIRLAAAEMAIGGTLGPLPVVTFNTAYADHGFAAAGPGEVFVDITPASTPALDFAGTDAGDRSGGLVTPNMDITAISRKKGAVGGKPADIQQGTFAPSSFFPLDAKLLGDIALHHVIAQPALGDFDSDKVIKLTTRETDEETVTELVWKPALREVPTDLALGLFVPQLDGTPASLDLTARFVTAKSAGAQSTALVVGDLRNFQLSLLRTAPFIAVKFDRLRFQSETGKKTDVDPVIREVAFIGPLEFVNDLKDYLNFSAGGFSIELLPTHLTARFQLPLPAITIGVFALQNLTFTAGATIPFTGEPVRFRFGFSTKEDPFLISVLIFGGGGFFELAIGPDGVEEFQMSLEFGVMGAIDLGVASGSVSITAGIYLAIGVASDANPEGKAELTGFIKLKGEVDVLGLITLALLMEAGFTYIPDEEKAVVRATIVVEVDVLLFSGSVEIEYEKRFGGSNDPTFGQGLTEADWKTYADAFAEIGA